MKKLLFGIFAHPDDEAFGPCATLLLEAKAGTDIHLITFTTGQNGMNPDNLPDIGSVRLGEWKRAGQKIGAKSMHHLGYTDGTLNNDIHLEAARRLEDIIVSTVDDTQEDTEIEILCMDLNGVSGHIDHIVASRSACFTYYTLKQKGFPMGRLRLFCMPDSVIPQPNTDFVFMEKGHPQNRIDEVVDGREVVSEVKAIMRIHHTQRSDAESHISQRGDDVAINHFIILDGDKPS